MESQVNRDNVCRGEGGTEGGNRRPQENEYSMGTRMVEKEFLRMMHRYLCPPAEHSLPIFSTRDIIVPPIPPRWVSRITVRGLQVWNEGDSVRKFSGRLFFAIEGSLGPSCHHRLPMHRGMGHDITCIGPRPAL